MLVEFSVKNFRSIKDLQTISFVASALKSSTENEQVDKNNIVELEGGGKLFKTIGIYGANASGKSNIVKALDSFVKVLTSQPSSVSNLRELCQPFLFQDQAEETESFFQIVVLVRGVKYRYGLTVKVNPEELSFTPERSTEIVCSEWLYSEKKGKSNSVLFQREGTKIVKNTLQSKTKIPNSLPSKHTLFLNFAAAFDAHSDCYFITDHLRRLFISNFEVNHDKFRWLSVAQMQSVENKNRFIGFLSSFNLNYEDIFLEEDVSKFPIYPQDKIVLKKNFHSESQAQSVWLNLKAHESAGTQKMFDLAGLLLVAFSMPESACIVLDEIDGNFHPSLLIQLVNLFNNPAFNRSNTQLLFTSHDTNLMSPKIMRRDQFFFTEKREDNSSRIYSLSELRGVRNDADFAKQYLSGYYGALPVLENFYFNKSNELTQDE